MKAKRRFELIEEIRRYFTFTPYTDIMTWITNNIVLTDDVSSEHDRPDFSLYPYQIEVLKQWEDTTKRKRVILTSCEQMGKSTCWIYGLLYKMLYDPSQSLVIYPSSDKSSETNTTKLQPLMRHIKGLKEELARPKSYRADRYSFPNCVSYFQRSRCNDNF